MKDTKKIISQHTDDVGNAFDALIENGLSLGKAYQEIISYTAASKVGHDGESVFSIEEITEAYNKSANAPISKEKVEADLENAQPSVLFWLESSLTPSHAEIMVESLNKMVEEGLKVKIMTSEDTLSAMTQNGKIDLSHYGLDSSIEYVVLPSQSTYAQLDGDFTPDPHLKNSPFEFMGNPYIRRERLQIIENEIGSSPPDIVLIDLWPCGYGMFSDELNYLSERTKMINPDTQVVSFARDIPYQDQGFDTPEMQLHHMATSCDKVIYKGDEIFHQFYPDGTIENLSIPVENTGHFLSPGMPEKNDIPDEQRKVLVSGGGGFSPVEDPEQNTDLQLFMAAIESKPHTIYADREWQVLVSSKCPPALYELIREKAEEIGGIELGHNVPVMEHRQLITDSAAFITNPGYSGIVCGVAAGVPTIAIPTAYATGGLNDRLIRSEFYDSMRLDPDNPDSPRPATLVTTEDLKDPKIVAEKFNQAVENHSPDVKNLFNFRGEEKLVEILVDDFRANNYLPPSPEINDVIDIQQEHHIGKTTHVR